MMKRLKIGILGTRGIPNHYGGFEQFAEQLSAGLAQRGHTVSVYNSSLHPFQEKEWNGVQIIHCRDMENKLGTTGQFIYDWHCINDSRKRDFDILLHLGYTSDSIWHWRWPKKAINIVNMDGLEWQRSKYNKPTRRFLKWAESLAANNAHSLIADSPAIRDHLAARYNRLPVYIPYGAEILRHADPTVLEKYGLLPQRYFLMIARMEPENNIEMIIEGHLLSGSIYPLFVIGNITNKFGRHITSKYNDPKIKYSDAIYNKHELDNLRYYSTLYFHGHSVGGTNPSLIEAMACRCYIAAHDNRFNKAVLNGDAGYFSTAGDISGIIRHPQPAATLDQWKSANIEKVAEIYNQEKIVDSYEKMMLNACGAEQTVVRLPVAEAV
jgi:glycosyltransferase involved in cell wall biosynthesis